MPSLLSWGKAVKSPCFLSNNTNKNLAYTYLFDLYQKVQFNSKSLNKKFLSYEYQFIFTVLIKYWCIKEHCQSKLVETEQENKQSKVILYSMIALSKLVW